MTRLVALALVATVVVGAPPQDAPSAIREVLRTGSPGPVSLAYRTSLLHQDRAADPDLYPAWLAACLLRAAVDGTLFLPRDEDSATILMLACWGDARYNYVAALTCEDGSVERWVLWSAIRGGFDDRDEISRKIGRELRRSRAVTLRIWRSVDRRDPQGGVPAVDAVVVEPDPVLVLPLPVMIQPKPDAHPAVVTR